MVPKGLKRFLGFETIDEKIERYMGLEKQENVQKSIRDELAIAYTSQKRIFNNSLNIDDEFVKAKIKEKNDIFNGKYFSELKKAKEEYDGLKLKREKILQDEDFSKAVKLYKARQCFDNNEISLLIYNEIIKAVTKKNVKYADSIVFNSEYKILILQRAKGDENAGKWVIPGGHVDPGETWEDAAKRELKEEAGIDLDKVETETYPDSRNVLVGEYKKKNIHIKYFKSYLKEKEPTILLDDNETHDYKWVTFEELKDYDMIYNMKENINKIIHPWKEKIVKLKKSLEDGDITPQIFTVALNKLLKKAEEENLFKETKIKDKEIDKGCNESIKKSKDQLKEMISEHERLVKVLEPHAKMDKKVSSELEIQKKELESYKKQLSILSKAEEYTLSVSDFDELSKTIKKAEELVDEVSKKIEQYGQ